MKQNCVSNEELRVFCSNYFFELTGNHHYFDSHWLTRFCRKYSNVISKKEIALHDISRATIKKKQIIDFYSNLSSLLKILEDYGLLLNMDETGFSSKFQKGKTIKCIIYNECEIAPFRTAKTDYRDISLVSTIALNGKVLKNMIITSRKTLDKDLIQETNLTQKFVFMNTESGYMTEDGMICWIRTILKPYVEKRRAKIKKPNSPTILIMDNCPSHRTERVQNAFNEIQNLFVLFLPPNSTHLLQPLDLFYFVQLKENYQQTRRHKNLSKYTEKILRIEEATNRCNSSYNVGLSWKAMGLVFNHETNSVGFNTMKINEIINSQPE